MTRKSKQINPDDAEARKNRNIIVSLLNTLKTTMYITIMPAEDQILLQENHVRLDLGFTALSRIIHLYLGDR